MPLAIKKVHRLADYFLKIPISRQPIPTAIQASLAGDSLSDSPINPTAVVVSRTTGPTNASEELMTSALSI